MTTEELHSYRLNSLEEPSDEMLECIMLQVQEAAIQSSINAQKELERRFNEMCKKIAELKSKTSNE